MSLDQDLATLQADVEQLKAQQLLPAELLDRVSGLLGRRDLTQVELANWSGGAADGGPAGDGMFPLTDGSGFVRYVPSPAKVATIVSGGGGADFSPSSASADRTAEINTLISAATKKTLTFGVGDYPVSKSGTNSWCIRIADKSDLTIVGGGSRFVSCYDIADAEGTMEPTFQIEGCTNFTLKDARFGYNVPPSGSGVVTEIAVDRSGLTFLAVDEPPHSINFDRYITQDSRTGITEVTEYAARDSDYDPEVNYSVLPLDGQDIGQPGRYQVLIPLIEANLASATVTDSQLTFTTSAPHGLPDGARIIITGAQGLEVDGISIVNGLRLSAMTTSATEFVVQYTEDEPISIAGASPYVPNTGNVKMQRIPIETAVGDRFILWHRKHLAGPINLFGCKNVTLGTTGGPLVFDEAAAVIVKGRDIDGLNFDIYSRRGAAGALILRDVRGIVTGNITCEFSGDDVIQFATGMWMNQLVGTVPVGQNYLDIKFATSRTQQPQLTLPRKRDLVNFSEPTYNNLVATLMVTDMQPRDAAGTWRIFFDGIIPAGLTKEWFVHNASCKPKFRLGNVICRGGGRLFLPKTDDCEVDFIGAYGMNNSVVLSRDPSSPQHPNSGGAAGGFRCRKLIARGCQWEFGNRNPAVLSMRRNGLANQTTNSPSDYWYNFDDVDIDGCGYGGVAISGFNAIFGRLRTRMTGQLRGAIPASIQNPQARNDLYAEQGVLQVDDHDPGAAFTFFENTGGFIFFPNGSLLVRESTIASGDLAFAAAKKLQVGHERRARVWIDGHEQDPASYVANDTALPVFKTAPLTTPGATAKCVVEHVRC